MADTRDEAHPLQHAADKARAIGRCGTFFGEGWDEQLCVRERPCPVHERADDLAPTETVEQEDFVCPKCGAERPVPQRIIVYCPSCKERVKLETVEHGEDDIVERLRDRASWTSGFDLERKLCAEAADEIERLRRSAPREPLDDARAAYMNMRTCICGEDASKHYCPHGLEGEYFDPDWERVRKRLESFGSAPREAGYVVLYEGSDLPTLVSCDVMTKGEAREVVRALQPESDGTYRIHPVGPPIGEEGQA